MCLAADNVVMGFLVVSSFSFVCRVKFIELCIGTGL
jgi:hypothetical protein